jgi:hypothetical protein
VNGSSSAANNRLARLRLISTPRLPLIVDVDGPIHETQQEADRATELLEMLN